MVPLLYLVFRRRLVRRAVNRSEAVKVLYGSA